MDWESLIEESVIDFIAEQARGQIELEELDILLGVAEAPGGSNEFFMAQILKEDESLEESTSFTHKSGITFIVKKNDEQLFNNLVLRTAQVATEEGVHTVVTFVPRIGVDFNSESDKLEE